MKGKVTGFLLFLLVSIPVTAQYTTLNAHSHNDYSNDIPFWLAYYNHFGSIEADIWAVNGELFVAHDRNDITAERTLDALYIMPLVRLFGHNNRKPWHDHAGVVQLLIDLKTPADPTLSILAAKLAKYPEVFDPKVNPAAVRIVISGNRPEASDFTSYPAFILYDGLIDGNYNKEQLERIPLFSEDLAKFTKWRGIGDMSDSDRKKLSEVIRSVHDKGKKIRFWNAPDNIAAWKTFMSLGIDFINTDHINELAEFLESSGK